MRRGFGRAGLAAGGALSCVIAALTLSQCFAPTYADCAFRCGPQAPMCPDEYECRADGYCHLRPGTAGSESSTACPYSLDLSAQPDLGAGPIDAGRD